MTTVASSLPSVLAALPSNGAPGFAISIRQGTTTIRRYILGFANLEHSVPISATTRFHVASLAKQFTAFGLGLLVREGLISFDDQASKYLPDLPILRHSGITISHLLHHTSGLRDQWVLADWAAWRGDDTISSSDVLWLVSRQAELNFTPGARFLYSNTGYTLLADIVAAVSGSTFRSFVQDRIFSPLGMTNSIFVDNPREVISQRAWAYRARSEHDGVPPASPVRRYETFSPSLYCPGATSLFTTLSDLEIWDNNFHDPVVGDRDLLDLMRRPSTLSTGRSNPYGLGFFNVLQRGIPVHFHAGNDFGFFAYYCQYEHVDLSIIALSNANYTHLASLCEQLLEQEGLLQPKAQAGSALSPELAFEGALQEYSGTYAAVEDDEVRRLQLKDGNLITSLGLNEALVPISADSFRGSISSGEYRFGRCAAGKVTSMKISTPLGELALSRLGSFSPHSSSWDDLVGLFYSHELGITVEFAADAGRISLLRPKGVAEPLTPVATDLLIGDSFWVRIPTGAGRGHAWREILISHLRARRMRFQRVA